MISDTKPFINKKPFTMYPFVPKSEEPDLTSQTSSIPQLLSFLKSTFQDQDFAFVQETLMGREKSLNHELQKLRTTVELQEKKIALYDVEDLHKQQLLKDSLNKGEKLKEDKRVLCEKYLKIQEKLELLGKSQALYNLESLKKDDQLKDYLNKCENLRENVARLEEENRVLCNKNLRIEERYKKINDDFVEEQKEKTNLLFERIEELKSEKNAAEENVRAYEKKFIELNDRVSRLEEEMDVSIIRNSDLQNAGGDMGSEVNLGSSQGKDGVIDSPHEAKSVCHSTGNSNGKEPLPINSAWDNGNPIRNSMACEAGDCIKNNLKTAFDKPGSSHVIQIIDDNDEITYASKSSDLSMNITCAQMKPVCTKDSSYLMPKRKRSMRESENIDSSSIGRQKVNDRKMSFVGDNSSNPEHSSEIPHVTPCEDKMGSKYHSQLPPSRPHKPNWLSKGSDSVSDNDSSNPKNLDLASIKESQKWLSKADLCSAFETDLDLCVHAVCALYRRQVSGIDSSKGFSCSKSDEKSITILGQYLTNEDHKLKRKAADIKSFHEMCKGLAIRHCQHLFQLYQSKEDPLFCPGAIFSKL